MISSGAVRYDDGFCRMFVGDAVEVLAELPEQSVHCCVTSPPYFGLRSYLPAGHPDKVREGGTQETPELYVEWLVEVFRGVWRVLRDDGTCWLNLGDSYNSGTSGGLGGSTLAGGQTNQANSNRNGRRVFSDLKHKDLLMIPARVALALQADGWFLRSEIIWSKKNCMPESVGDRPTRSHEQIYMLSKSSRYFFDQEAVREPHGTPRKSGPNALRGQQEIRPRGNGQSITEQSYHAGGRNVRDVWEFATRPYPSSHYATFPPELPLRCIKAGTSEHGVCSERSCGAPWRRVVERHNPSKEANVGHDMSNGAARTSNPQTSAGLHRNKGGVYSTARTIGFEPGCACSHDAEVIPATVLDPFSGSGTTGLVARKLGRRSVLIDLDERNVKLLEERMGYQGVLL